MHLGDPIRCLALVTATLLSAHLACTCHRRGLSRQIAEFAERGGADEQHGGGLDPMRAEADCIDRAIEALLKSIVGQHKMV